MQHEQTKSPDPFGCEESQSGWFARYSREQRDLSASVEEALAVSSE